MKRLAVIPSDPMQTYWDAGYDRKWFEEYFNPCKVFDEVYLLSPVEPDNPDLVGTRAIKTRAAELPRRMRELNIDVLRAYGGFWPCDVACRNKALGVPVIVSIHDTNPDIYFDAVERADFVWCAPQLVNFVMTKFPHRKRIWELPNGIDFSVMRPYPRSQTADINGKYPLHAKYKIMQVGRRTRQKNLDTLIRALKLLGADYCLLAVGRGEVDPYRQLAQAEGVSNQCVFIDSIDNTEMPRYFAWADCLAHPTRWEGMSLLMIEALACEAIVVVSDIPEMKGMVEHGHNGLLVGDYDNPQALAEMIKTACTDESVRKTLKHNARKSVEQFEMGRVRQIEADYYAKVLQMKKTGQLRPQIIKELRWKIEDTAKSIVGLKWKFRDAAASILPQPIKNVIKKGLHRYRAAQPSHIRN